MVKRLSTMAVKYMFLTPALHIKYFYNEIRSTINLPALPFYSQNNFTKILFY